MATLAHRAPWKSHISPLVVGLSVVAAILGVSPIVAAIVASLSGSGAGAAHVRTAFATGPAGEYAVVARNGQDADTIYVAPAADPSAAGEIARIPHLAGYASTGAVSPEGRRLVLVTADAGTPAHPGASLYLLNLETADLTRLAIAVDYLQTAAWAPDGRSIVFTRIAEDAGTATVTVYRVDVDGGRETEVARYNNVLGAYVVGFDPAGRLVTAVIDARGSTAYRDGVETARLSTQITRDWKLSPDGGALAFIESDVSDGLHYRARIASLAGAAAGDVTSQAAGGEGQQLGVAWKPGASQPAFGQEPGSQPGVTGVSAQSVAAGFDVPLAYSRNGERLAVQHWSGADFSQAGKMSLQLLGDDGSRAELATFTRFYGWATR